MTDERPLHVRVAEALGWSEIEEYAVKQPGVQPRWIGWKQGTPVGTKHEIPLYDLSWCATGPLIEKYAIVLDHLWPGDLGLDGFNWRAQVSADVRSSEHDAYHRYGVGPTPLIAVCLLLLELHKAGKLIP